VIGVISQITICAHSAYGIFQDHVSDLGPEEKGLFNFYTPCRCKPLHHGLGLGDVIFHDLRKTIGSVLAQNGVSFVVIQKLPGHSSLNLTNTLYANISPVQR
jgi:hypothetical protein